MIFYILGDIFWRIFLVLKFFNLSKTFQNLLNPTIMLLTYLKVFKLSQTIDHGFVKKPFPPWETLMILKLLTSDLDDEDIN